MLFSKTTLLNNKCTFDQWDQLSTLTGQKITRFLMVNCYCALLILLPYQGLLNSIAFFLLLKKTNLKSTFLRTWYIYKSVNLYVNNFESLIFDFIVFDFISKYNFPAWYNYVFRWFGKFCINFWWWVSLSLK